VTDAVHAEGGKIVVQLWHVGRVSHTELQPDNGQPVAPSAITAKTKTVLIKDGVPTFVETSEPRALDAAELPGIVHAYAAAARNAVETAGFDGVEIHGANGYLLQQFFAPSANTRVDRYGGSIENRARFAIEVATAVAEEIGADRTAMRLSPGSTLGGIDEGADGADLYRYLVSELDKLGLAYIHVIHNGDERLMADLRARWRQALVLNRPGRPRDQIGADIASGLADLEAYGQMVLANPDFIVRLRNDAPMNEADRATFFGGTAQGYIDYPALEASAA